MLTRETLLQIASNTCPGCDRPTGRHHAYPVTDPETLLTMLTDHPPRCRTCATEIAEALPAPEDGRPHLAIVIVIKVSSIGMPSGRLLKLHPEDPTTWRLHLQTPEAIHFKHITQHKVHTTACAEGQAPVHPPIPCCEGTGTFHTIARPATNEEAEAYLTPALAHLSSTTAPDTDEHAELLNQITRLQKHLPKRIKPSQPGQ